MNRAMWTVGLAALMAGCGTTIDGTLVDGMTGQPIPGKSSADAEEEPLRVVAKAVCHGKKDEQGMLKCTGPDVEGATLMDNAEAGLTCMSFTADVGMDGKFSLAGLCTSKSEYALSTTDGNLFLGDINHLDVGFAATAMELKAWRAPNGTGLFKLEGNNLTRIPTAIEMKEDTIFNTEEKVQHPNTIPESIPLIEAGQHLVVTGKTNVDKMVFKPLINSGPRKFGNKKEWVDQGPWAYIGTKFTDDSTFERVEANFDKSKASVVEKDGHAAMFIPADAIAPGRYVLMKEGDDRAAVVDFGQAGETPK